MSCIHPLMLKGHARPVPCGQCMPCRIKKQEEWVLRLQHEAMAHTHVSWTTITYNDKYYPGTVLKSDIQSFLKRFRELSNISFRYFLSGEYGDHTLRGHYHIILFGVEPTVSNYKYITDSWRHIVSWEYDYDLKAPVPVYESMGTIDYLRSPGLAEMRYIAKYHVKRLTGEIADEWYKRENKEPEFTLMSRRPGIGYAYKVHYRDDFMKSGNVHIGGKTVPVPLYYYYDVPRDKRNMPKKPKSIKGVLESEQKATELLKRDEERKQVLQNLTARMQLKKGGQL